MALGPKWALCLRPKWALCLGRGEALSWLCGAVRPCTRLWLSAPAAGAYVRALSAAIRLPPQKIKDNNESKKEKSMMGDGEPQPPQQQQQQRSLVQRMFLRKPRSVVLAEETEQKLERHLTLLDLLSIGIGGTVGSGIFVLSGLIAHKYAGPAMILSWLVSGIGCVFSGLSYAELASRIPSAGSAYAYTFVGLGELPAVIAAWCLTLEYGISGSAVARSWGDKMVNWLEDIDVEVWKPFDPGYDINPMAGIVNLICVGILLAGLDMGKRTVNFFTCLKMALVIFMTIAGLLLFRTSNLTPFAPEGVNGILRGATAAFFGYLGYDEVCCLAAEAKQPHRNLPIAVGGTIAAVAVLYMTAGLALVGMRYYDDIDEDSGFSKAFNHRGWHWAGQIVAVGELITLPLVVLISLLAQPRLQFAMAEDGMLPPIFSQVDRNGNLRSGILICGAITTVIAVFVPFTYLDDMISGGILLSFNLSLTSVVVMRRRPLNAATSDYTTNYMIWYNAAAFIMAFLWVYVPQDNAFVTIPVICTVGAIAMVVYLDKKCPEVPEKDTHVFRSPWVPYIPCLGIATNYFMVAQLEWPSLIIVFGFIGLSVSFYLLYGMHHSVGNNTGWQEKLELAKERHSSLAENGINRNGDDDALTADGKYEDDQLVRRKPSHGDDDNDYDGVGPDDSGALNQSLLGSLRADNLGNSET